MICLENVLKRSLQDVLKTSSKRLEYVLKISWRRLENVLKASWRCLEDVFARRLENILKTSSEDVWVWQIFSSWSRRLEDVLKTSFEDENERCLQDVSKTSSSRRLFAGYCRSHDTIIFLFLFMGSRKKQLDFMEKMSVSSCEPRGHVPGIFTIILWYI